MAAAPGEILDRRGAMLWNRRLDLLVIGRIVGIRRIRLGSSFEDARDLPPGQCKQEHAEGHVDAIGVRASLVPVGAPAASSCAQHEDREDSNRAKYQSRSKGKDNCPSKRPLAGENQDCRCKHHGTDGSTDSERCELGEKCDHGPQS